METNTCPKCGAESKGNDGIAEWYVCGSLLFNCDNRVTRRNQTTDCLRNQLGNCRARIKALESETV